MDAEKLGWGSFDENARDCDWSEADHKVIIPEVTAAVLDSHFYDCENWREEFAEEAEDESEFWEGDRETALVKAAAKAFEDSDGYSDWANGFAPMMNSAWPIFTGNRDEVELAGKIEEAGGCVSLVELNPAEWGDSEYALALSGGGMDLGWNLAAAYCAAEQVPPFSLLRNLSRPSTVSDHWTRVVIAALGRAGQSLRNRADELDADAARFLSDLEKKSA